MQRNPSAPTRSWRRMAMILALTLLLHWQLFAWISGAAPHRMLTPPAENLVTLMLRSDPPKQVVAVQSKPPAPVRPMRRNPPKKVFVAVPKPVSDPSPEVAVLPEVVDKSMPEMASAEPIHPILPSSPASTSMTTGEQTTAVPSASEATSPVAATAAPAGITVALPPSAEIRYDVQALRGGQTVYGNGKISWRNQGDGYVIDGDAGVLFFSVLTFRSEGSLDQDGIRPRKYSEKRFRKAETNTHFQRAAQIISFSASTEQYPLRGGEQDRASIIWQLAAIGRGDPLQFQTSNALQVFVAGVRDGELWSIAILGTESIEVDGSTLLAWHLQRLPHAGSYDTRVDIWLAPSREWYPVKLRQTERNGDYLDMTMTKITPL